MSRNSTMEAIKRLEFWQIVKKHRIGKTVNNRYELVHKRRWKPISEVHVKDFSEVHHINLTSLLQRLHQFTTRTSKEGDTSKELKERRDFSKNKKEYYADMEVRRLKGGLIKLIPLEGGSWLEFVGKESDIEWR